MPRKNRRLIYSGNGGHLYDGTTENSQQMRNGKYFATNSKGDSYYVSPSALTSDEVNVIIPETFITANPDDVARGNAQRWWREHSNVYGEKGLEQVSPEFDLIGLAPLVKPIVNRGLRSAGRIIGKTNRLANSPLTGNWTKIGNREYRLSPNSLGVNGVPIESRAVAPQITAENAASITRTVQNNGKIRLSLPSHTDAKPRQFVLEPAPTGDNKYYVHMRMWDDVENKIPASNVTNEEKQQLFDALYDELPEGAEILFPKSGPGNYGTRGTVAGLQRLSRNPRFTPGTKGTLQYLDKDGKTIKTYEGTSFIKSPKITPENAASITPEQWTSAQDAAIARGDMAEAQRLRDLHFKVSAPNTVASVNGHPLQLYHGTDATFNAFDISKYGSTDGGTFGRGIYTTPIKEYAELYGKNNMPLYMKLDNPRDYRNFSIGDLLAEKIAFGDDFATGIGIDGVIGRPSWKGFKGLEEYVSHNPRNIKSSLPITHDDNGVRIPLGERDNFNVNDIRYGLLPLGIGLAGYGLNQKKLGGRIRFETGGKTDNENNEGLFGNKTIDNVTSYLPILGTVQDAYNLYKNPSWENAGWLALSLAGDLAGFGVLKGVKAGAKAVKAARKTEKAAKEALDTYRKTNRNIIARSIREEDRKLVENYNKAQVDRALKEGENFWHKATVYPISGAISTYDAVVNYTQNKSNKKRYGGKVRLLSAYD